MISLDRLYAGLVLESDVLDPFEVLGAHEGALRDHVQALIHLQLGLPYTNRPHQELRQRAHDARVIRIRAPRDGSGKYTWAAGAAGRIVLHQLLDHIRTTGCGILSHGQLRALFATAPFSEQTCQRQLRRLFSLTIEISSRTGAVLDRQPVGSYGETGICVSDWVASAVHALPALPSSARVREVAMAQRYGWRSGSTFPTSPMPIDLLLWTTHVAPQVHGSATIPLTTLQQHIGTETTAKKQSIYFLGLEIEGWLPAINAEFPGLRVTLMESALILAAIQRCDVAVYGVDSAIDRRFSRLRNGSVIAGSR